LPKFILSDPEVERLAMALETTGGDERNIAVRSMELKLSIQKSRYEEDDGRTPP